MSLQHFPFSLYKQSLSVRDKRRASRTKAVLPQVFASNVYLSSISLTNLENSAELLVSFVLVILDVNFRMGTGGVGLFIPTRIPHSYSFECISTSRGSTTSKMGSPTFSTLTLPLRRDYSAWHEDLAGQCFWILSRIRPFSEEIIPEQAFKKRLCIVTNKGSWDSALKSCLGTYCHSSIVIRSLLRTWLNIQSLISIDHLELKPHDQYKQKYPEAGAYFAYGRKTSTS